MSSSRRHLIQLVAAVALVCVLGGVFALVAWSDQPRVRYASLKCVYRQIYNASGPVDVVVVGTSRTKWGVSPQAVSMVTSDGQSPPLMVLNLARSWRGMQQMFQEIKDVENERGIKMAIVVEYSREGDVIATSQRYYDYFPDHAAVVPIGEFLDDPVAKPREPAYLRVRDLLDLGQQRIDFALDRLLTAKAVKNEVIPVAERPLGVSDGCTGKDRPLKQAALDSWEKRSALKGGTWREKKPGSWRIGAINADAQRQTIKDIVQFGKRHNLAVYFVLMPRYMDPPAADVYVQRFERVFGATLLVPPADILEQLYDGGYSDPNHLNEPGRDVYSRWLGMQIRG